MSRPNVTVNLPWKFVGDDDYDDYSGYPQKIIEKLREACTDGHFQFLNSDEDGIQIKAWFPTDEDAVAFKMSWSL